MSNIQVTNIKNLSGNQTVAITSTTGELLVKNDLIAESGVEVAENLIVSGVSTFSSSLDINGTVEVAGIATFSDNVDITQALDVDGGTDLDDLRVSGIATFTNVTDNAFGNVNTGSVQFDGGLGVARNVSIGGSLYVNGQSYFAESVIFAAGGAGTIQFGNNSNDTVDIQAQVGSDLIPNLNTGYDLGSSTKKWRHISIAGNAGIGSLNVTGVSTFVGISTFENILYANQLDVSGTSEFSTINVDSLAGIGSIDAAGVSTFRSGIHIPGGTFSNNELRLGNYSSEDFTFQYNTSSSRSLIDNSNDLHIRSNSKDMIIVSRDSSVDLRFNGVKKLETTGAGVSVTGNIALIGDGRLIDFIGDTVNNDYETGIRWWESPDGSNPRMAIDYNGDSGLDSSGQIEIKGNNNNTSSYDELVVLDRFGRVGVGSTRPTHLVDVLGDSRFTGNVSVSGITTLGIVTGATYYGDGSNLTGITTSQISGYGGGIGGIGEIVQDTSPQLGGNLDLNSNNITGTGNISITGNTSITGITTFSDELDVGGDLNVSGVSTFSSGNATVQIGLTTAIVVPLGTIQVGSSIESTTLIKGGEINLTGPNSTDLNSTYYSNIRLNRVGGNFRYDLEFHSNGYSSGDIGDFIFYRRRTSYQRTERMRLSGETGNLTVTGSGSFNGLNITGVVTATSFSGDGGNLTGLTGASAATYGDGGSIPVITVNSDGRITGISTATNTGGGGGGGGTLSSRSLVEGTTGSLAPNATGTLDLTGFKSYALMYVGLSTAGWIRIYTDSTSRTNDASRSIGDDPTPGSGVIAEVITTGISTQQNISPFVMGGNMDNTVSNTMYISITNLSSDTQAISVDLKILQLEA